MRLGEEGEGFMAVMLNFNSERLSMAVAANRMSRCCLEEVCVPPRSRPVAFERNAATVSEETSTSASKLPTLGACVGEPFQRPPPGRRGARGRTNAHVPDAMAAYPAHPPVRRWQAIGYARQRRTFGKPLIKHQARPTHTPLVHLLA
jgi:hypothetical protein